MKAGIYKITVGSTFYYGQSQDVRARLTQHRYHLKRGDHDNARLQRAHDKYGEPTGEVVLYCETNELNRYEQWFLDTYHGMEKCANMARSAESGMRGYVHSEETRTKAREAALRREPMSEATRAKIGAATRNRVVTPETRAKLSAALTGRSRSAEHNAKIAEARRGTKLPEHRVAAMKKAAQQYVYTVTYTDGREVRYNSLNDAARDLGIGNTTFRSWISGKKKPSAKHAILTVRRRAL